MSKVKDIWSFEAKLPTWTSAVVAGLKRLDAADSRKVLDGRYLGVNLTSFAKLYAQRSHSESVPTFTRLVAATEALRSYSTHRSADALGQAMLEGAQAMLENRPAHYAEVEGFASRFVDVEFAVMVDEIAHGNTTPRTQDWTHYWQIWLGGCWPDLFKQKNLCDGSSCSCEFPR